MRIYKPKVFLSHSKNDVEFIKLLKNELEQSNLSTWFDEIDIRHGQPWLSEIFNNGLAESDIVLVYLTEKSIKSKMVQRELDSSLISDLSEKSISLLLYCENEKVRNDLRSDIRTLQIPLLNRNNLKDVLPRIISEIWRNYCEITVTKALKDENLRRRNAELELENFKLNQNTEIFSEREMNEYSYIFEQLNRDLIFHISTQETEIIISIRKIRLFVEMFNLNSSMVGTGLIRKTILYIFKSDSDLSNTNDEDFSKYDCEFDESIITEFRIFGLLRNSFNPKVSNPRQDKIGYMIFNSHEYEILQFNETASRFFFWIKYNNLLISDEFNAKKIDS